MGWKFLECDPWRFHEGEIETLFRAMVQSMTVAVGNIPTQENASLGRISFESRSMVSIGSVIGECECDKDEEGKKERKTGVFLLNTFCTQYWSFPFKSILQTALSKLVGILSFWYITIS